MKKHVPELSEIYNLLDQEHSQRNLIPVQNASAFHVSATSPNRAYVNMTRAYPPKPNRPVCTHCGYNGHTVDTCYKVHGCPPNFKHKVKEPQEKNTYSAKTSGYAKPIVAQLALTDPVVDNVSSIVQNLSKDQIQGMIDYFNSQLKQNDPQVHFVASTSSGTITTLPGMAFSLKTSHIIGPYQGDDAWEG